MNRIPRNHPSIRPSGFSQARRSNMITIIIAVSQLELQIHPSIHAIRARVNSLVRGFVVRCEDPNSLGGVWDMEVIAKVGLGGLKS